MAKVQATTTKSPLLFSPENGIYEDDLQAVIEMLNHAFGHNPKVHVSMACDDTASGAETHDIQFPTAGSGFQLYFDGLSWIDPDVATIDIDVAVNVVGANTPQVRVTIGSTSVTLNFAGPGLVRQTGTLATSATGTGEQRILIELNAPVGTGHSLEDGRIEDQARTASLPDPPDE